MIADLLVLGNLCLQQGNNVDAIAAFEKVLKIDPDRHEAWSGLAICYQNLGDDKKAMEAFRKAKRLSAR